MSPIQFDQSTSAAKQFLPIRAFLLWLAGGAVLLLCAPSLFFIQTPLGKLVNLFLSLPALCLFTLFAMKRIAQQIQLQSQITAARLKSLAYVNNTSAKYKLRRVGLRSKQQGLRGLNRKRVQTHARNRSRTSRSMLIATYSALLGFMMS